MSVVKLSETILDVISNESLEQFILRNQPFITRVVSAIDGNFEENSVLLALILEVVDGCDDPSDFLEFLVKGTQIVDKCKNILEMEEYNSVTLQALEILVILLQKHPELDISINQLLRASSLRDSTALGKEIASNALDCLSIMCSNDNTKLLEQRGMAQLVTIWKVNQDAARTVLAAVTDSESGCTAFIQDGGLRRLFTPFDHISCIILYNLFSLLPLESMGYKRLLRKSRKKMDVILSRLSELIKELPDDDTMELSDEYESVTSLIVCLTIIAGTAPMSMKISVLNGFYKLHIDQELVSYIVRGEERTERLKLGMRCVSIFYADKK